MNCKVRGRYKFHNMSMPWSNVVAKARVDNDNQCGARNYSILWLILFTLPHYGAKYCGLVKSVSVCSSVSPAYLRNHSPNFTKFSVHVTCGRVSVLLWQQRNKLCIFSYDVVIFHSGANAPESKTTRMFRSVRQVEAPSDVKRRYFVEFATWRHLRGAAKSAVSDCILLITCNRITKSIMPFVSLISLLPSTPSTTTS